MPQHKMSEYVALFGDEHAGSDREDATGADITLLSVFIRDLADIQQAITGISIIRNKRSSHLGLTPDQFAARQQILSAARAVLISERKQRLEQMFNYWSQQRGVKSSTTTE
jgi:hypothetical protein